MFRLYGFSINPLNAIHEKYNNNDLIIASLTEWDSKKAVLDFEKRYKIKYPGYINAVDVVKSYHVTAFPTFYFIDKEGKIGSVFVGYADNFENNFTSAIDNLLRNKQKNLTLNKPISTNQPLRDFLFK